MRITAKFLRRFLPLIFLIFLLLPSIGNAAKKVAMVEGLIERVTYDSIEVRGKYYNISGVPLLDASGKKLTEAYLRQGTKVEIFFEGGRITSILIHRRMAE